MRDWEMTDPICWMERLRPNALNVAGFIWAETENLARRTSPPSTVTLSYFRSLPLSENVVIVWRTVDVRRGDVFSEQQISDFMLLHPVKFSNRSEHSVLIRRINEHRALREIMHRHWCSVWGVCFSVPAGVPAEILMVFVRWAVLKPRWTNIASPIKPECNQQIVKRQLPLRKCTSERKVKENRPRRMKQTKIKAFPL